MKKYDKKGISLIVLVITIIVMIILAAAIILSLNNSGIIGKANKAKQDSDTANLKEYVNVLEAEWELMTADERSSSGYASKEEYVNKKLADKGYSAAYSVEGEIYTTANEVAKDALSKGLKIGDEVKYTVTATSKPSAEADNGYGAQTVANKTDFTWRYIGVSDNGELLIAPDITSAAPRVYLKGKIGYLKGPDELNRLCKELYSVSGKGTARSMNIDDVTRILGYTGEKGSYDDTSDNYVLTTEAKKIGDIEEELGKTLSNINTPESGKNLKDYYSDAYYIDKTSDVKEMKNSKYVNLIYPSSGYYWLASSSVYADFGFDSACFGVRWVHSGCVCSGDFYNSRHGSEDGNSFPVRPVVSLTSKIQTSSTSGSGVWEFVS